MNFNKDLPILSDEELKAKAPSIFAMRPAARMSERYQFIRTIDAINTLRDSGWQPVEVMQKRSRFESQRVHGKHLIRMRNPDVDPITGRNDADIIHPEVVLTNSHNGASSYQIMAGMFRMVCSNGLIVADSLMASITLRHIVTYHEELTKAALTVAEAVPAITTSVRKMSAVKLETEQAVEFARRALIMKWHEEKLAPFAPGDLLLPRREEDNANDLWTIFNVVQENLMKGGLEGTSHTGRRHTSRPVADLNMHIKHNKELYEIASEFAQAA